MTRFSFSMQKILDLRTFRQREAEAELGLANAEVSRIQQRLDAIAASRAQAIRRTDGTPNDMALYAATERYCLLLSQQQEASLQELAAAQVVAEQKREVVRQAMQDVKVLEKLRDKKYAAWRREALLAEEQAADDIVTASYN